jgi:hypothetical protein
MDDDKGEREKEWWKLKYLMTTSQQILLVRHILHKISKSASLSWMEVK